MNDEIPLRESDVPDVGTLMQLDARTLARRLERAESAYEEALNSLKAIDRYRERLTKALADKIPDADSALVVDGACYIRDREFGILRRRVLPPSPRPRGPRFPGDETWDC